MGPLPQPPPHCTLMQKYPESSYADCLARVVQQTQVDQILIIKIHLKNFCRISEHFPDENAFVSSIHSTSCASSYYRQIIWIVWLFWLIDTRLLPWIEPIILTDFLFTVFIYPEAFILNDIKTGIGMNLINDKRWLGLSFILLCWLCP